MPFPLAAALTTAVPAFAQWLSGSQQSNLDAQVARENTDKSIAAQKEMAELAYQRNVGMWQMQNSYNSPAEQMARYKAAGLNPNLAVGGGNPGNAGGIPAYQAPSPQYAYKAPQVFGNLSNSISQFMDLRLRQAQLDNVRAQTNNVNLKSVGEQLQNKFMDRTMFARTSDWEHREKISDARYMREHYEGRFAQDSFPDRLKMFSNQADASDSLVQRMMQDLMRRQLENQWMKAGVTPRDNIFLRMGVRGFPAARKWVEENFGY